MADIRDEDIDSDLEVDDEVDVKNAPVETDAMLSINSHMV